jgi:predicted RNA polymerase sigma factor
VISIEAEDLLRRLAPQVLGAARRRREETLAQWALTETSARQADENNVSGADDTLVLLFMCCHPSLSAASQIALTLRAVGV